MVRALQRYRHENRAASTVAPEDRRRVLIIGAGDAGTLIAREMLRHPETGLEPIGFLDDDPAKRGQRIATPCRYSAPSTKSRATSTPWQSMKC